MTGHGRWYTSQDKSVRGILYLKRGESLNSCLFSTKPWSTRGTAVSHELAPLSLDWLTDRSRSEGRVESILSILDFTDAVFKAWCCLFNSSVEFSPTTMNMLYVVIESTCGAVIDVEAANCCGASNRKSGTPSPPWAGVKVTSWRRSLGRGSVCRSVYHHHHHHHHNNFFNNNNFIELYKQKYNWLPMTRTLANSNLALTRTKIDFPRISVIHLL